MTGGNINAEKCVAYLRSIGVEVAPDTAARWIETQRNYRERKRAHNRELKRSCGHFRTYVCRIVSAECGDEAVTFCWDCCKHVARKPWTNPPPRGGGEPMPTEKTA